MLPGTKEGRGARIVPPPDHGAVPRHRVAVDPERRSWGILRGQTMLLVSFSVGLTDGVVGGAARPSLRTPTTAIAVVVTFMVVKSDEI
jgi:hypothetical protein